MTHPQNTKFSSAELPNMKEGMLLPVHKIRIPSATEGSSATRKTDRRGSQGVGAITDLEVL